MHTHTHTHTTHKGLTLTFFCWIFAAVAGCQKHLNIAVECCCSNITESLPQRTFSFNFTPFCGTLLFSCYWIDWLLKIFKCFFSMSVFHFSTKESREKRQRSILTAFLCATNFVLLLLFLFFLLLTLCVLVNLRIWKKFEKLERRLSVVLIIAVNPIDFLLRNICCAVDGKSSASCRVWAHFALKKFLLHLAYARAPNHQTESEVSLLFRSSLGKRGKFFFKIDPKIQSTLNRC